VPKKKHHNVALQYCELEPHPLWILSKIAGLTINNVIYLTKQDGLWPRTGRMTNIGEGEGEGFTINIPLPGNSGEFEDDLERLTSTPDINACHPDLRACLVRQMLCAQRPKCHEEKSNLIGRQGTRCEFSRTCILVFSVLPCT
jgi:hypothetical protein